MVKNHLCVDTVVLLSLYLFFFLVYIMVHYLRSKIFLRSKISLLIILFSLINAQEEYLSTDDVKTEWQNFTKFQRQELVNFATFLYNEGFYERALLSYFHYLYKYPNDALQMATYFQIGKCYENMKNWDLAKNYYNRILNESSVGTVANRAAQYQLYYINLKNKNYSSLIDSTNDSKDPYELIFRAYAHFESLQWDEAQQAFKASEALFNYSHYSKQIRPWYKAIKAAKNAPLKEKNIALLSSLAPGGGFIYLKQTENAIGTMGASILLYTAMLTSAALSQNGSVPIVVNRQKTTPVSYDLNENFKKSLSYPVPSSLALNSKRGASIIVPPAIIALGLYAGSMWKSVYYIEEANIKLVSRYAGRVSNKLPIESFMDYETPDFIIR